MSKLFRIDVSICCNMDEIDPVKTKKLVFADMKLKALPNILGDFFSLLLQDIFVGRLRRSGTTIQLLQLIDELATDLITPLSHCIKHLAL